MTVVKGSERKISRLCYNNCLRKCKHALIYHQKFTKKSLLFTDVAIDCCPGSNGATNVTWFYNRNEIPAGEPNSKLHRMNTGGNSEAQLLIRNYSLVEHSGCYHCEYKGQSNPEGCYVHAGNTQDVLKPSFYGLKTQNCENTEIFEGEPLHIECGDIKVYPFSGEYSVYWFVPWNKDGYIESKEMVLEISRVTVANNGTYFVVANNSFGFNYLPHFDIIVKPNPIANILTLDDSKETDENISDDLYSVATGNYSKILKTYIDNFDKEKRRHVRLPFEENYVLVYIILCFLVATFALVIVYKCATKLRKHKREKVMTFAMRQRCQSPETGPRLAESKTSSK